MVMARFERPMTAEGERSDSFAAEAFLVEQPAVEQRVTVPPEATRAEREAAENLNKLIDNRARTVERMMDEGFSRDRYGELWGRVEERLQKARYETDTPLGRYLSDAENAADIAALSRELQDGASWDDVLAREVHELVDEPVSDRRLRAIAVLSREMNETVRAEPQPDSTVSPKKWEHFVGDWEDRRSLLRVSEIANAEVVGARVNRQILSAEELRGGEEYARQLRAMMTSHDIPSVSRERAGQALIELRRQLAAHDQATPEVTTADADSTLTAEREAVPGAAEAEPRAPEIAESGLVSETDVATAAETPATHETAVIDQAEVDTALERAAVQPGVEEADAPPEPEPAPAPEPEQVKPEELKSREAVFGREGIGREDLRGITEQLRGLLEKDTPESALAAARTLADLKRARVELSGAGTQGVLDRLAKHRAAFGKGDAVEQAQYMVYLKYLGAVTEVTEAERRRIELAIVDRTAHRETADLDRLCVRAKYLGVRTDFDSVRPYLERDMRRRLQKPDGEEGVAMARARRKYLGLAHGLPDEHLAVEEKIDRRMRSYEREGRWDRYARLRMTVDYVRGSAPVSETAQEGLRRRVGFERFRAQHEGDWQQYTQYVADAATLARQADAAAGEPTVRRPPDAAVYQFLATLEERDDLKSDEGRMREWAAQAQRKAAAERKASRRRPESRWASSAGERGVAGAGQERAAPAAEPGAGGAAEREVDPEAHPRQAAFEEAVRAHRRETGEAAAETDILSLTPEQIQLRRTLLKERDRERLHSTDAAQVWARDVVAAMREGGNLRDDLWERLEQMIDRYGPDDADREERLHRYVKVLANDYGYGRDMREGALLSRLASNWMERTYHRFAVAKGWGKVRALSPLRRQRLESWREVISARQDAVRAMRAAAGDERSEAHTCALLQQLADEYELIGLQDAAAMQAEGQRHATRMATGKNLRAATKRAYAVARGVAGALRRKRRVKSSAGT